MKESVGLRCVEDQSVPLALNVVVLRLLRDVETIKLQLPGKFLLSFEDHQWDLDKHKQIMFRNIQSSVTFFFFFLRFFDTTNCGIFVYWEQGCKLRL